MARYCIDKALDLFDKVIELGKDEAPDVFWRTKHQKMLLYSQTGRAQDNIDEALTAINNGSEDAQDWICLIAAYSYGGDEAKAYEWILKAVPKFPDNAALYVFAGDTCRKLKKYDEAFQYWNKALELDDEMYDARYSMGFCHEELGAYDKAYELWLEIARDLEKDGYEVEKQFPLELAAKCQAILTGHPA